MPVATVSITCATQFQLLLGRQYDLATRNRVMLLQESNMQLVISKWIGYRIAWLGEMSSNKSMRL